jgi:hypothetical protein
MLLEFLCGERRQALLIEDLCNRLRDRRLRRNPALLVRDNVVLPTGDLDQVADLNVGLAVTAIAVMVVLPSPDPACCR